MTRDAIKDADATAGATERDIRKSNNKLLAAKETVGRKVEELRALSVRRRVGGRRIASAV